MKRLLSCTSSEMLKMDGQELKQAILASEGRTVMTETVVAIEPLLGDLTNAELAVSFGSDMVLLNCFDCNNPEIKGLPECDNPVEKLKEIVGRPIGCNLEPVDLEAELMEERRVISTGRQARKETYIKAQELGFNFICLTGNPGVGVSNHSICEAIKEAKSILKRFKFPEIPDEYFVTEDYCWMQIAAAGYKLRWYNQPIYICEYLNDGLTNTGANSVIGHKKNYKGYCLYVRKCIELKPFIQKMAHLREFNKTMKVLKVPFEKRRKDIQMSRICYFQLSTFGVLVAYLIRKVRYRK